MRVFDRILQGVGCLLLLALLVCVLLGVITRGLGTPLIWTDEAARMLMVWLATTGWVLASRGRAHVRVRFFQDLLPKRAWAAAETVIQLLVGVLGLAVAGFAVALVRRNMDLEATSLPISIGWLYVPIIPAGLMTAAQALSDAARRPRPATAVAAGVE